MVCWLLNRKSQHRGIREQSSYPSPLSLRLALPLGSLGGHKSRTGLPTAQVVSTLLSGICLMVSASLSGKASMVTALPSGEVSMVTVLPFRCDSRTKLSTADFGGDSYSADSGNSSLIILKSIMWRKSLGALGISLPTRWNRGRGFSDMLPPRRESQSEQYTTCCAVVLQW